MAVKTSGYIVHKIYSVMGSIDLKVRYSMSFKRGYYRLQEIILSGPSNQIEDESILDLLENLSEEMPEILKECIQDFADNNKDIPSSQISQIADEDIDKIREVDPDQDILNFDYQKAADGYDFSLN